MAKRNDLRAAMKDRSPAAMRQAITPVNIFSEAQVIETTRKERTDKPNAITVRKNRSTKAHESSERNKRTVKTHDINERLDRTILEPGKRETSRESFEVYLDQLDTIDQLQEFYKKKTGRPLTNSRIVREALDMFLPLAIKTYQDDKE